ncbi:LysR family transcriptional regulator ArgP [Oerskovia sp. Sa1BUA8]|uniref:LysR family transcriptional regulator ArgP n=1 Tax=Oerskovia douganii TaxID=2762210 RepID=A0A9D5U8A5_9CELL|nr:LysR family transcriptional regulator ArgP [Oerskovia douganii]MBE7699629.1 LysR family transcriptional regulator ArgP [Oerskovia douganii]
MVDLQPDQLRTLDAIATTGTFEAAAQELGVTPSAVSQRMRALEASVGQVLVRRGRPATLTAPGEVLVRHARRLALQHAEVLAELDLGDGDVPELTLVITGDALTTWALPVLADASSWARLEIVREDQDHSIDLLRDGTAVAAVTSVRAAVPGCRSTPLGRMRYRPLASPAFAERWFPDGPTTAALSVAPVVVFDRKDDLQDRYLGQRAGGPRHHVPASHEFLRAVELGMGWGMLPDLQSHEAEAAGRLVGFDDRASLTVPQYWQQWRLHSPTLDRVAAAVREAAAAHLR